MDEPSLPMDKRKDDVDEAASQGIEVSGVQATGKASRESLSEVAGGSSSTSTTGLPSRPRQKPSSKKWAQFACEGEDGSDKEQQPKRVLVDQDPEAKQVVWSLGHQSPRFIEVFHPTDTDYKGKKCHELFSWAPTKVLAKKGKNHPLGIWGIVGNPSKKNMDGPSTTSQEQEGILDGEHWVLHDTYARVQNTKVIRQRYCWLPENQQKFEKELQTNVATLKATEKQLCKKTVQEHALKPSSSNQEPSVSSKSSKGSKKSKSLAWKNQPPEKLDHTRKTKHFKTVEEYREPVLGSIFRAEFNRGPEHAGVDGSVAGT
mmetsp:Transcript_19325/g.33225  ORF Transcript_19325/g.33225 Transcript_19325/m.33225 type:complete len:316 (+) Transcript_19325:561-1508(+)